MTLHVQSNDDGTIANWDGRPFEDVLAGETLPSMAPQIVVGHMIERWLEEDHVVITGAEWPDMLVRFGLATVAPFDPDLHGPSYEARAGDPWYTLTDAGRACRTAFRNDRSVRLMAARS